MTCSENNVLIEHICVLDSLNIWIDFVFYLTYECLFFLNLIYVLLLL